MKINDVTEGLRDTNPCWKGYKPVGTKKKAGRTVPNCVPKEGVEKTDIGTMPTVDYVKNIYSAAAENGLDAPDVDAVKKQMVLAPNGEVDLLATMQKALQTFQDPKFKQMLADLDALVKQAENVKEADVVSKISAATAKDVTIDNPDGTKTIVPLGSGMLSKDEQGNLVLNKAAAAQANQQAAAGGQQQQQPIKPGQQVRISSEPVEDVHRIGAVGGTHGDEVKGTNTKSAISGDEEHDEISKLLINRLRKMAGLEEAEEETPPAMPDIQGLTPGQAKDLGNGEKVALKADGTVSYTGGFGEYVYDKTGKAIKYNSPSFGGYSQSKDLSTGGVTKSYAAGPMSVQQGPDGETSADYDLGDQKLKLRPTIRR